MTVRQLHQIDEKREILLALQNGGGVAAEHEQQQMGQSALELTESGHAYKHRILQGVELVEKEIEDRKHHSLVVQRQRLEHRRVELRVTPNSVTHSARGQIELGREQDVARHFVLRRWKEQRLGEGLHDILARRTVAVNDAVTDDGVGAEEREEEVGETRALWIEEHGMHEIVD